MATIPGLNGPQQQRAFDAVFAARAGLELCHRPGSGLGPGETSGSPFKPLVAGAQERLKVQAV